MAVDLHKINSTVKKVIKKCTSHTHNTKFCIQYILSMCPNSTVKVKKVVKMYKVHSVFSSLYTGSLYCSVQ